MSNTLIKPIAIGLGVLLVATAPIWLPRLLGIGAKRCECGVRLTSGGILPYCKCEYQ